MIYECTDCKHCANFSDGFRVFCMHPDLPPDKVCEYHPVGDGDASDCVGFQEGNDPALDFSWDDFGEAEQDCIDKGLDIDYVNIRKWIEQHKKEGK